jgi:hypothetical protein
MEIDVLVYIGNDDAAGTHDSLVGGKATRSHLFDRDLEPTSEFRIGHS